MIDDHEIRERPEELGPVSRGEAQGMWTQLDALRIAQQDMASTQSEMRAALKGLVSDAKWTRALLFLLLLWQIGSAVVASSPARTLVATVSR